MTVILTSSILNPSSHRLTPPLLASVAARLPGSTPGPTSPQRAWTYGKTRGAVGEVSLKDVWFSMCHIHSELQASPPITTKTEAQLTSVITSHHNGRLPSDQTLVRFLRTLFLSRSSFSRNPKSVSQFRENPPHSWYLIKFLILHP